MKLTQFFQQKFTLPTLLGVTKAAEHQCQELVLALKTIAKVTTAQEQEVAVERARDCQTYIKQVKEAGLAFRRPINDFVALVKQTEDKHLIALVAEQDRIKRLCADFQEKENRRVAAEEQAQRAAYQKAEAERLELERKANEAAIKAAESGKAKDFKQADKLEAQAQAAERSVQGILAAPLPEKAKPAGLAMKKVLRWEVTDIQALVKCRPDLCKIEPKGSAIQAACVPEMPNKPDGLRLWWEQQPIITKH